MWIHIKYKKCTIIINFLLIHVICVEFYRTTFISCLWKSLIKQISIQYLFNDNKKYTWILHKSKEFSGWRLNENKFHISINSLSNKHNKNLSIINAIILLINTKVIIVLAMIIIKTSFPVWRILFIINGLSLFFYGKCFWKTEIFQKCMKSGKTMEFRCWTSA